MFSFSDNISHDSKTILNKIAEAQLIDNTYGQIYCEIWEKESIKFSNGKTPAAANVNTIIVLSPSLANETISKLLSVIKRNKITIGFTLKEAIFHNIILIVGDDFSDEEINELMRSAPPKTKVIPIHAKPNEIKTRLEELLHEGEIS